MGAPPFDSPADASTAARAALPSSMLAVVLAGGGSRRMGRDKAALTLPGGGLPQRAAERLALVCPEVVVADRGRGLVPGLPSLADGPGRGPAAGVLGAATVYPGRPLLVLACDLPEVPAALLADLARSPGCDWAAPRWRGRIEPLCALYGPAALDALARRAASGGFALHELAGTAGLAVRWLEGEALAAHGAPEEMFLNLNTPADLEAWLQREKRRQVSTSSGAPPQRSQGQMSRRKS